MTHTLFKLLVVQILESKPRSTRASGLIGSEITNTVAQVLIEKWNRTERSIQQFLHHRSSSSSRNRLRKRSNAIPIKKKQKTNKAGSVIREASALKISDTPSNTDLTGEFCEKKPQKSKRKRRRKPESKYEVPSQLSAKTADTGRKNNLLVEVEDSVDSMTPQLGDTNLDSTKAVGSGGFDEKGAQHFRWDREHKKANPRSSRNVSLSVELALGPNSKTPEDQPLCHTKNRTKSAPKPTRTASINSSAPTVDLNDDEGEVGVDAVEEDEEYVQEDDADEDEDEDVDEEDDASNEEEDTGATDDGQSCSSSASGTENPQKVLPDEARHIDRFYLCPNFVFVQPLPLNATNFPGLRTEGLESLQGINAFAATSTTRFKRINQDKFRLRSLSVPQQMNRSMKANRSAGALVGVFDGQMSCRKSKCSNFEYPGHGCLGHIAAETCAALIPESLSSSIASGEAPEDAVIEGQKYSEIRSPVVNY